jgi:hypothetical protein
MVRAPPSLRKLPFYPPSEGRGRELHSTKAKEKSRGTLLARSLRLLIDNFVSTSDCDIASGISDRYRSKTAVTGKNRYAETRIGLSERRERQARCPTKNP